jgi:hypothetical protein
MTPAGLPPDIETAAMTRLRREAHTRMLGKGLCTRPFELDCRTEFACETCTYFHTGPSSCPSSSANATAPGTTTSLTAPPSSTASSNASPATRL